jgi:hypothetical protein
VRFALFVIGAANAWTAAQAPKARATTMHQLFPPESSAIGQIHDQLAHFADIKMGMPVEAPTRDQISTLVETAFWASLKVNEGRHTRVCVAVAVPENARKAVALATPVEYDEAQITKLSPAVSRDGYLVVSGDPLKIWGVGRERRSLFVDTVAVEIVGPGLVRVDVGLYRPYMVLNGRSISTVYGTGYGVFRKNRLQETLSAKRPASRRGQAWGAPMQVSPHIRCQLRMDHAAKSIAAINRQNQ